MKQKNLNNKELSDLVNKNQINRNCGNADHLTGEKGEFKSEFPHGDGVISIGYLEDACQWIYYHNDLTDVEKIKRTLSLEKMIQDYLGDGINYIPTWSRKLKRKLK